MTWLGLPALMSALIAAVWPRSWSAALAVLAAAAGLGMALPTSGVTVAAWAVALGLLGLGLLRPLRRWPLLALPWLLAGALGRPLTDAAWPELASSALAAAVLSAATAGLWSTGRPRMAALVLALLPWAPAGGSVLHGWATLPLPLDGTAAAVQVSGSFGADLADAAPWVAWLQASARLLVLVAVWQPRLWRQLLGLAALLLAVETGVALGLPHLHVAGVALPSARGGNLDVSLLALAVARLMTLGWLLRAAGEPSTEPSPETKLQAAVDVLLWLSGAALTAVWATTALDGGLGDPAAAALLATVVAVGLARARAADDQDTVAPLARGLAWLAALWLVGGADAGWRVAGALLR